ncbi:hypothetical protein Tco_0815513, partial [Tanacetum coccineum]
MILELVENGPLIWPTVKENRVTRIKKYAELSTAVKIQADCDMKAINSFVNTRRFSICYSVISIHLRIITRVTGNFMRVSFVVPVFFPGDDPIACLNKAMAFLTVGRQGQSYSGTGYKSNATSSVGNNASGQARLSSEAGKFLDEQQLAFLADPGVPDGQVVQTIIPTNAAFQTEDLDTYDSNCADISNAKAVFMANISNLLVLSFIAADFSLTSGVIGHTPDASTDWCNGDILNEIMEVQTVFDQIDAAVQQSSVDKQCLEIAKKELLLENDQLLQQIIKRNESCDKCFNLEAELLKSQNAHNDLLKKLENSVAKLLSENERLYNEINHVKQVFKEQFDSIKKTCDHTKEQSGSLIDKLNLKSAENKDLKAQIQDKVFVIMSLKNDLRKVKGKVIVDIAAPIPSANTIVPGMFKLDLEPLAPRLLQNREAHINYLKYTQEQADILRGIVEQAKATQPLDKEL